MNERGTGVLEQYELEVYRTCRTRGAVLCETGRGLKLLKEWAGSHKRIWLEYEILSALEEEAGIAVDNCMRNRDGGLLSVDGDQTVYVLRNWYEGRECSTREPGEIQEAARMLGKLHLAFGRFQEEGILESRHERLIKEEQKRQEEREAARRIEAEQAEAVGNTEAAGKTAGEIGTETAGNTGSAECEKTAGDAGRTGTAADTGAAERKETAGGTAVPAENGGEAKPPERSWTGPPEDPAQLFGIGEEAKEESLTATLERHNRELKRTRSFVKGRKRKTGFELVVIGGFEKFYRQAMEAAELAAGLSELPEQGWCHGEYSHHHVLLGRNLCAVTDFSRLHKGVQVTDLYYFTRKILEKHRWNLRLGRQILDTYAAVRPMTGAEWQYLYILFLYPEKYWKQMNYYLNSNKAWIPERNINKLRVLENQFEARSCFLDELKLRTG